jgi:hypothetical protein
MSSLLYAGQAGGCNEDTFSIRFFRTAAGHVGHRMPWVVTERSGKFLRESEPDYSQDSWGQESFLFQL